MTPPVTIVMWLMLSVNELTSAVAELARIWYEGMKNNAVKIDDRRKLAVPDEIGYLSKIAENAEQEFRNVLNPSLVSRKGKTQPAINRTHAYKIKQGWEKYQKGWNYQFETVDGVKAKRFIERLETAKDIYGKGASRIPIALTGIRSRESGPATIAVYWLTGDSRAKGMLRESDRMLVPSQPFNITTPVKRNSLRQVLLSNLVRCGAAIIHSQLDATVITDQNTLLDSLAQGFVDPALGIESFGTNSQLHYVVENGQLFLSVKVART